jgi:VWFA-related protein
MSLRFVRLAACRAGIASAFLSALAIHGQVPQTSASSNSQTSPPAVTLHAATRVVTVEVVARDHQGRPVTGLAQGDFQVFEQVAGKREKVEQKIAVFRAVTMTQLGAAHTDAPAIPAGIYTNLVTTQKDPSPPTVLLIDGLNTELTSQMQVRRQMIKMLASIPDNVPVAVFLLAHHLQLVQSFTTDPKLLKEALQKASGLNSNTLAQMDPRDDPDNMSAFVENISSAAALLPEIERFERETYAAQMDARVQTTLDALRSIARHIAGYPGRKNLLWVSSSFPIMINPDADFGIAQMRNYESQMHEVANALAEANVSVYPMDPAGLQVSSVFQASTRVRGSMSASLDREAQRRSNLTQTMKVLAEQTGGEICVNNNDLGDCVKRAVDDGSSFYEIAYYPDASNWHGEFHKIQVKTSRPNVRLSYRQGYYARPEGSADEKSEKADLERAACFDLLTSTSIIVAARSVPSQPAGANRYLLAFDPYAVLITPNSDSSYDMALQLAICTFDKSGKPLKFMQQPINGKLTAKEYAEARARHGIPDSVTLPQDPKIAAVRLVVKDTITGRMGSVNIPMLPAAAAGEVPGSGTAQH